MEIVSSLLLVGAWGFAVGAAGRWAVPGPDPMPAWLTIAFGIAGSLLGGGVVLAVYGAPDSSNEAYAVLWAGVGASVLGSALLIVVYRRLVEKRGITGPGAKQPPTRGFGAGRREAMDTLSKLDELRQRGVLTEEEFAAKKAELLARI